EQAVGQREITAQSDIFALGCVLYEMLAGEPPFSGPTAQAIVAKAARDTPQHLRVGRPSVPAQIDAAVGKALAKLPADRFASGADFAAALTGERPSAREEGQSVGAPQVQPRGTRRATTIVLVGVALVAVGIAVRERLRNTSPPDRPVVRFVVADDFQGAPAISPDGTRIAYLSRDGKLHVRVLSAVDDRALAGVENALFPTFSPDGRWIAYSTPSALVKIAAEGGEPSVISDGTGIVVPSWGPHDRIVFSSWANGGLWSVSSNGGIPTQLTWVDSAGGGIGHQVTQVLPSGNAALFEIVSGERRDSWIAAVSVPAGKVTRITKGIAARYAPTGHLLVEQVDGSLQAYPFDQERLTISGPAMPIRQRVAVGQVTPSYGIAVDGSLAYAEETAGGPISVVLADRSGQSTPLPALNGSVLFGYSPEGQRIIVGTDDGYGVYAFEAAGMVRLPALEGYNPTWAPDGRTVLFNRFSSQADGLYRVPADGTGRAELVRHGPFCCASWHADGRSFVTGDVTAPKAWDLTLDTLVPAKQLSQVQSDGGYDLHLSPDDRWLVYTSTRSSVKQVYVQGSSATGSTWQVSNGAGDYPAWARGGRELFYVRNDSLVSAPVQAGPVFRTGTQHVLFALPKGGRYAAHPDGQHFVISTAVLQSRRLVVATNWLQEAGLDKAR
ncbi:MAG: hypothetical protein ABI647_24455, partial [Gemmatimonadota bacterium]